MWDGRFTGTKGRTFSSRSDGARARPGASAPHPGVPVAHPQHLHPCPCRPRQDHVRWPDRAGRERVVRLTSVSHVRVLLVLLLPTPPQRHSLTDSLLASNGIVSSKLAGKIRFLDSLCVVAEVARPASLHSLL